MKYTEATLCLNINTSTSLELGAAKKQKTFEHALKNTIAINLDLELENKKVCSQI